MKIIHVSVDEELFKRMTVEKALEGMNWSEYVEFLFNKRRKK